MADTKQGRAQSKRQHDMLGPGGVIALAIVPRDTKVSQSFLPGIADNNLCQIWPGEILLRAQHFLKHETMALLCLTSN